MYVFSPLLKRRQQFSEILGLRVPGRSYTYPMALSQALRPLAAALLDYLGFEYLTVLLVVGTSSPKGTIMT